MNSKFRILFIVSSIFLLLLLPSIISSCSKCGNGNDRFNYLITSASLSEKLGASSDSANWSDSMKIFLRLELLKVTSLNKDIIIGSGSLYACSPVEPIFSPRIDSVSVLSDDSISSLYPAGKSLNHLFIVRNLRSSKMQLDSANKNKSWSILSPWQEISLQLKQKINSTPKHRIIAKIYLANDKIIWTKPFWILF